MEVDRMQWRHVICFLAFLSTLLAQESGSITGQVLDPSGATIHKATVTVRNENTGAAFDAATDESGFYRAPQLTPGTYTITVSQPGFRTLVPRGIQVRIN